MQPGCLCHICDVHTTTAPLYPLPARLLPCEWAPLCPCLPFASLRLFVCLFCLCLCLCLCFCLYLCLPIAMSLSRPMTTLCTLDTAVQCKGGILLGLHLPFLNTTDVCSKCTRGYSVVPLKVSINQLTFEVYMQNIIIRPFVTPSYDMVAHSRLRTHPSPCTVPA